MAAETPQLAVEAPMIGALWPQPLQQWLQKRANVLRRRP